MIFGTKQFNKEIKALPELNPNAELLSSQDQARIKQNIMLAIAKQSPAEAPMGFWARHKIMLRYGVSAALGLSLVAGTAFASGNAIPGDILYPVKITTEKVQLSLATTDQSKAVLQAQFAQQRIVELQKLAAKTPAPVPVAALPQITPASSTPATTEPPSQSPLEQRARAQAMLEVNNALSALKGVQSKLQSHGDSKDAQNIANNISSLQNQANVEQLLGSNDTTNNSNNHKDDHQKLATTTLPSLIHKSRGGFTKKFPFK